MDTEQQVRLNFLEEAEEYFEQIETILLNLATADDRPQQLDAALRAAHSIKGSAGMMGFMPLSQVAHRMEDSFKILRARLIEIDTELETLLLQGVDCLRTVKQCHCDNIPVDDAWINQRATPIFEQLHARLGDVTEADENQLLAANEDVDITVVMFSSGVDGAVSEFEAIRPSLSHEALRQQLLQATNKMMEFGIIGGFDAFMQLCDAIQTAASHASLEQINAITDEALELWQRSTALVAIGRAAQLPTSLAWSVANAPTNAPEAAAAVATDPIISTVPELNADDLSSLQASLSQLQELDLSAITPAPFSPETAPASPAIALEPDASGPELDMVNLDPMALSQLQDAIADISLPELPDFDAVTPPTPPATPAASAPIAEPKNRPNKTTPEATIRVSVEQLQQINNAFGTLILDRNAIQLRLDQFEALMNLLRQRMHELEGFNLDLRRWYDQASIEGLATNDSATSIATDLALKPDRSHQESGFDALEMDQYSALHLLAQAQMETIVKLQEVIDDVTLTHQEIQQANNSLNLTSRTLQKQITRTQMRPFESIVGRFPRVIRDYAVKYGKPVRLKIEGESTLFERYALDIITDPINHLLRNAFDHGIESPEMRQAHGKPAEGTITIRALQRGNQAIITMSDDGGGINLEKIREKVRKHGIPAAQVQAMSEQKLLDMIFDAGFSTADQVTELSGRGVGMDVVKSNLKKVNGDITVTTQVGKGTTFTISIPLSLSIFRVMLLDANGFTFAITADDVKEILTMANAEVSTNVAGECLKWQGRNIPLHNPEQYWQFSAGTKLTEMSGNPMINHPLVLVVGNGDRIYGLAVKRFWSEQEVAIRPVHSPMPLPRGFSGVTTLGDGRIVPLLDPIVLLDGSNAAASNPTADQAANLHHHPDVTHPVTNNGITTILVVDDSIHARRYLTLSLKKAGYQVEQARDGQEAVDQLLGGLNVQAVICDVEMPRLDGYGVLSEIKTRNEFRDLPIAMLTSRSSEKHRKLAMNLGANAYFSKPYNEQELLQTLSTLV